MQRLALIMIGALGLMLATPSLGKPDERSKTPEPPVDAFTVPPSPQPSASIAQADRPAHQKASPAAMNQLQEAPPVGPPPPNWVPSRHNPPLAYTPEGEPVIITPAATALGKLNDSDREFVQHFMLSTNGDLNLARMAAERASSADTRDLAKQILKDETAAMTGLRTLVEPRGVTIALGTSQAYRAELERLTKTQGARFDREYLQGQLQHHLATVNLLRVHSEQGHDALLHAWSAQQLPLYEHHIQTLRELLGVRPPGV